MTRTQVALLACFVLLATSSCSDYYVVKPDVVLPASGSDPLPLIVGLKVVGQSLSGGFSDMGPAFASRLGDARLFKTILYPVRSEDKPDLLIEANFSGKHIGDSSSFVKGFFTGLFLFFPSPVVEYDDRYVTTAVVIVTKGGQQLKSYSAGSDVVVQSKLMAKNADIQTKGVTEATKDLLDRIVAQFYNDRTFFTGLRLSSQ